jgi:hypothetical protein
MDLHHSCKSEFSLVQSDGVMAAVEALMPVITAKLAE